MIDRFEYYINNALNASIKYNNLIIHSGDELQDDFGYVYILVSDSVCKIGKSKNWKERTYGIEQSLPFSIRYRVIIECNEYGAKERILHRVFKLIRVKGEWFNLSKRDIDIIASIENMYQGIQSNNNNLDIFATNCIALALCGINPEYNTNIGNYFLNAVKRKLLVENEYGIGITRDFIKDITDKAISGNIESINDAKQYMKNIFDKENYEYNISALTEIIKHKCKYGWEEGEKEKIYYLWRDYKNVIDELIAKYSDN